MRRIALAALAAALLAGSATGCQSIKPPLRPDPGATGFAHVGPYVVQRYLYPLPVVERAAIEAMADMMIHNVHLNAKEDGVKLTGQMYDGRLVCTTLESEGQETIATVNIDVYGDEPLSKILLQRIGIRIATLPQGVAAPFDPRALTDSILNRGSYVEGYRGALLR